MTTVKKVKKAKGAKKAKALAKAYGKEKDIEENVLAMYLKDIIDIPMLSREEENEAARAAAAGDMKAREKLINGNLRFVINVAKKYQGMGLPLADLISEGNVGLLYAVDRYNADFGLHFISYAVWWIRQSILRAINEKSRMIRLPINRVNDVLQIEKAKKVIGERHDAEEELQEISTLLRMDKEHVEEMINLSRSMVSLEKPVPMEHYPTALGDFIEDEHYTTPDQDAVQGMLEQDIEKALNTLNQKEAAVIRFRFGLGGHVPASLQEIGDRFNLTKERVRQIEQKALNRLRHLPRRERLAAYIA